MNHAHMSSTWCACTVNCKLKKEGGGRVLALFLRERDVPGGRRLGFWLVGSLAQALRGCDPLRLAEPWAPAICCSPGYCWAGLQGVALYVTASGERHAKKSNNTRTKPNIRRPIVNSMSISDQVCGLSRCVTKISFFLCVLGELALWFSIPICFQEYVFSERKGDAVEMNLWGLQCF